MKTLCCFTIALAAGIGHRADVRQSARAIFHSITDSLAETPVHRQTSSSSEASRTFLVNIAMSNSAKKAD